MVGLCWFGLFSFGYILCLNILDERFKTHFNPSKTELHLNNNNLAVNTLRLRYADQPVNAV
jgi:hypothetical protein